MTTKRRITRHELKEDQFVTSVFKLQEWAEENLNKLLIAAGIVVVVVAAVWFLASQSSSRERQARELLGRAEVEMRNGQTQIAAIDFQKVLDDYGSSSAAPIAAFKLGNLYFETNDFARAEEAFQLYLRKYAKDEYSRFSAQRGVASAQAAQGKLREAAASYFDLAMTDSLSGAVTEDFLKCIDYAVSAGDVATAQKALEQLERIAANSEEYRTAKILMIERGILKITDGEYN